MEKLVDIDADQDSKQKKGKKVVKKRKKSRQHVMLEKNNMTNYTGLRQWEEIRRNKTFYWRIQVLILTSWLYS